MTHLARIPLRQLSLCHMVNLDSFWPLLNRYRLGVGPYGGPADLPEKLHTRVDDYHN